MGSIDDIKDILRGSMASLGGFGGRMLSRLVLIVAAGQLYGAEAFGILGQIAAITEITATIATLGLKRSLLDYLSAHHDDEAAILKTIKEALLSSLVLAAFISLALGIAWPFLFTTLPMPAILYISIPAIAFAEVAGTAIRFRRIIRWEVISRMIMEPWAFLIAALLFYYTGFVETGLIISYAISHGVAAIGIAIGFSKTIGIKELATTPINWRSLYQIPMKSLPVGITDLGVMAFRRIDILLLSLVADHQTVGVYYMAQQLVTVPHKIHQLFEPMMSPVIAKLHHQLKSEEISAKLAGICRWVFTLQLAITVPFIMFSANLLGLFGAQFPIGATVLIILLIAELLDGSFALTETPLIFAKPKLPPKLIVLTLLIEIPAITGLAHIGGMEGAALGFLLAMASLAAARLYMLSKELKIKILNRAFFRPIGFAIVVGSLLALIQHYMVMDQGYIFGPAILLAVALNLGLVRLLGLTKDDKFIIQQLKLG